MAQAITQGAGQGEPTCQPGWNKRDKLLAVLLWHPGALVTELINEDTSVKIKVRKKSQLVIE